MGAVQDGCSCAGGDAGAVDVADPTAGPVALLEVGIVICCPEISSASAAMPLAVASVSGEMPLAAATDDRVSPVCTVWVVPEVVDADGLVEAAPLLATSAAPSSAVGISIVSPA